MNGWIMLIAFAAIAALLLFATGFPRKLWTIAATALTLGAAGYAWQGNPALPGHPVAPEAEVREIDPAVIEMREAMFGRFNLQDSYFKMADAMTRQGKRDLAAKAMSGALVKRPDDGALWTWFGMTLTDHDNGVITPAAERAFARAIELAPEHPGPRFFYGLALIRSRQLVAARAQWAKALELTPETMSYRPTIAAQLDQLDQLLAANGVPVPAAEPAQEAPPAN